MKTNYAQQLAWFEQSVQPKVLRQHSDKTSAWQANSFNQDNSDNDTRFGQSDLPHDSPIPRNRQRKRHRAEEEDIEESSPFLTTMQDDLEPNLLSQEQQEQQISTPIPDNEAFMFDEFGITLVEEIETVMNEDQDASNFTPMRTHSDISLYYDASDHWSYNMDSPPDREEKDGPSVSRTPPTPLTPPTPPTLPTPSSSPSQRERIEKVLLEKFNVKGFIPNQYEAITAAINNHDIFLLLPAGPSRNLCYQLPVFFHKHPNLITIILTPSLMHLLEKDDHTMEIHDIPTIFVSNSKKTHKKNWISRTKLKLETLKDTQLLYMTYNDFSKCESTIIKALYRKGLIGRFIIEESHCISQWWGTDDFIFGYSKTTQNLRTRYPHIPITALTAISNERTHLDIIHHLGLVDCKIYKKSILL